MSTSSLLSKFCRLPLLIGDCCDPVILLICAGIDIEAVISDPFLQISGVEDEISES